MRKTLLYLLFCTSFALLNGQTILFEDDFESYTITTPNTGGGTQIPPGYTSYDVNGDAYNWGLSNPSHWTQPMGDIYTGNFLASVSYHTGPNVPVQADNILVLPLIAIPADATDVNLSFYAGSGTDPGFFSETYDVIVTTVNTQAAILAATPVYTETLPFQGGETKTVNLDDFIGQSIYISFYHRDTFDMWVLGIDDIVVSTGGGTGGVEYCDLVNLDCAIEQINSVTFAGIENLNTGCGTAATNDFTSMVANVTIGESYDMIVDLEADPAFPDDNAFFFIDWNQNGVLDDAGEVYELIMHTGTSGEYTVSVTVPDGAMIGETRLRVGIAYNSGTGYVPQPCPGDDGTLFGEYEDYTVNVSEGGGPSEGNCDLEGTTVGGPTWDRPLADGSGMSAVGVGVTYHVYGPFTVDTAGSYSINSTQEYDGFIFIYQNAFDPTDPLTNYLAGNDDGDGGIGTSDITVNLATGTEYFLITTGFDPTDSGTFVNTITGPGAVTCDGGIGPEPDCEVSYVGTFQDGLGNLQTLQVANDFTVAANTEMQIDQVKVNIFGNVTTSSIYIYENLSGTPGDLIGSHEGLTPTTQTLVGTAFGFNIYEIVLDLPTAITATAGTSQTIFWLGITTTAGSEAVPNYWEAADATTNAIAQVSTDGGFSWAANSFGQDGAFTVAGVCGELGISEMDSFDFAYYPNPVKDELNITSQKVVQSVSVYNLAGQQVSTQKLNLTNGKVSTRALSPGVYVFRAVLDGGQVETFKVIKK
ncbi:GEVED domain-containing protein [Moheibacter sediminis]|uniref:Por secretion system C-terminal sorting domain-containing protein n=1 Tax=Moheibacter sediminis TaxID=1434700 RepID=A0A1W2AIP8_9FLAO|nr:GEVED domain-containing protein [Moheibacter sediminis]SMC60599.1 Por secretion system C-terminal sorting domain-containing protein [Moheibacter sediminis]